MKGTVNPFYLSMYSGWNSFWSQPLAPSHSAGWISRKHSQGRLGHSSCSAKGVESHRNDNFIMKGRTWPWFSLFPILSINTKTKSRTWSILWGEGERENSKKPAQVWRVWKWVLAPSNQKWGHGDEVKLWITAPFYNFLLRKKKSFSRF